MFSFSKFQIKLLFEHSVFMIVMECVAILDDVSN